MKILYLSTLSLIAVMLIPTGAYAHCEGKHTGNHPHCQGGGGGGGGGGSEYGVLISMADPVDMGLEGTSGDDWTESTGGKSIEGHGSNVGMLTSLSFFTGVNSPFTGYRGSNCFRAGSFALHAQAGVSRGRGGRAESKFWFRAHTDNLNVVDITPLYLLIMFGTIDGDWPPALHHTTTLVMGDWELRVANEGADVKSISCIGEGEFTVNIEVLRNK
jgi:hypothetical protein